MTLGLGIFLSSLFLGVIYLFVATKDRWNWKKILFIWPLYFVLVVGVIGGTGFYIYNQYENKPKAYDTYLDIPLNATENDLIFIKGDGYDVKQYDSDKNNIYIRYQEDKENEYTHNIRLKEGKVWRISCFSNRSYDCPPINKISLKYKISEVEERLGKPDYESSSDDSTERLWIYEKLNLYMNLKQGKIKTIGIFDPSLGLPEHADSKYDFIDIYQDGDKKLTIKEIPFTVDEEGNKIIDINILNEINAASSEGDEVVWSEYVALKEKQDEANAAAKERDRIEGLKAAEEHKKAQEQKKAELEKLKAKARKLGKAEELAKANKQKQADIDAFRKAGDDTFNTNWQKLKKGLATYQVYKLLGKPVKQEGNTRNYGKMYWYYSENRRDGAHVLFKENRSIKVDEIESWKAP